MNDDELRRILEEARRHAQRLLMQERNAWSLEATALVNEAFLRFHPWALGRELTPPQIKAALATITRHTLQDYLRQKRAQKNGGELLRVSLDADIPDTPHDLFSLLEVEEILAYVERRDEEGAKLLELRYYGGLTEQEIADFLGKSLSWVQKKSKWLHAWLARKLRRDEEGPAS